PATKNTSAQIQYVHAGWGKNHKTPTIYTAQSLIKHWQNLVSIGKLSLGGFQDYITAIAIHETAEKFLDLSHQEARELHQKYLKSKGYDTEVLEKALEISKSSVDEEEFFNNREAVNTKTIIVDYKDHKLEIRKGGVTSIDITKFPAPTKEEAMRDYLSKTGFRVQKGAYFGNETSPGARDAQLLNIDGLKVYAADEDQNAVDPRAERIGKGVKSVEKKLKEIIVQLKTGKIQPKFLGFDIDDTLLGTKFIEGKAVKETLNDRKTLRKYLAELIQLGVRIVIITDNDIGLTQKRIVQPLMEELKEKNVSFKENQLTFYADGMVTKAILNSQFELYLDNDYEQGRIDRDTKEMLLDILGEIEGGKEGLLRDWYLNELTEEKEGKRVLKREIMRRYPNFKPPVTSREDVLLEIQRRSESEDGSVAQISILPIPSRRTGNVSLEENELDERDKLVTRIAEKMKNLSLQDSLTQKISTVVFGGPDGVLIPYEPFRKTTFENSPARESFLELLKKGCNAVILSNQRWQDDEVSDEKGMHSRFIEYVPEELRDKITLYLSSGALKITFDGKGIPQVDSEFNNRTFISEKAVELLKKEIKNIVNEYWKRYEKDPQFFRLQYPAFTFPKPEVVFHKYEDESKIYGVTVLYLPSEKTSWVKLGKAEEAEEDMRVEIMASIKKAVEENNPYFWKDYTIREAGLTSIDIRRRDTGKDHALHNYLVENELSKDEIIFFGNLSDYSEDLPLKKVEDINRFVNDLDISDLENEYGFTHMGYGVASTAFWLREIPLKRSVFSLSESINKFDKEKEYMPALRAALFHIDSIKRDKKEDNFIAESSKNSKDKIKPLYDIYKQYDLSYTNQAAWTVIYRKAIADDGNNTDLSNALKNVEESFSVAETVENFFEEADAIFKKYGNLDFFDFYAGIDPRVANNLFFLKDLYEGDSDALKNDIYAAVRVSQLSVSRVLSGFFQDNYIYKFKKGEADSKQSRAPPKHLITFIGGGGKATTTLLRKLVEGGIRDIAAIVSSSDDGGSSWKIMQAILKNFGSFFIPPGDIGALSIFLTGDDAKIYTLFEAESLKDLPKLLRSRERITGSSLVPVWQDRVRDIFDIFKGNIDIGKSLSKPEEFIFFASGFLSLGEFIDRELLDTEIIKLKKMSTPNLITVGAAYEEGMIRKIYEPFNFTSELENLPRFLGLDRQKVIPVSYDYEKSCLEATTKNDKKIITQTEITEGNKDAYFKEMTFKHRILQEEGFKYENLDESNWPKSNNLAVDAIRNTKGAIVMGNGSVFTSLLPNLSYPDVVNALLEARKKGIPIVYIAKIKADLEASKGVHVENNYLKIDGMMSLQEQLEFIRKHVSKIIGRESSLLSLNEIFSHIIIPDLSQEEIDEMNEIKLEPKEAGELEIALVKTEAHISDHIKGCQTISRKDKKYIENNGVAIISIDSKDMTGIADKKPLYNNDRLYEEIKRLIAADDDDFSLALKNMLDNNIFPVVVADMDDTLTIARTECSNEMIEKIIDILEAGGKFVVFTSSSKKAVDAQILNKLKQKTFLQPEILRQFYIFVNQGAEAYRYDSKANEFEQIYKVELEEKLGKRKVERIKQIILETVGKYNLTKIKGDFVEDRGSQITFFVIGNGATKEEKKAYDLADGRPKRERYAKYINRRFEEENIEVFAQLGGNSSINISLENIDKGYGIERIVETLNIFKTSIVYFGGEFGVRGSDKAAIEEIDLIINVGQQHIELSDKIIVNSDLKGPNGAIKYLDILDEILTISKKPQQISSRLVQRKEDVAQEVHNAVNNILDLLEDQPDLKIDSKLLNEIADKYKINRDSRDWNIFQELVFGEIGMGGVVREADTPVKEVQEMEEGETKMEINGLSKADFFNQLPGLKVNGEFIKIKDAQTDLDEIKESLGESPLVVVINRPIFEISVVDAEAQIKSPAGGAASSMDRALGLKGGIILAAPMNEAERAIARSNKIIEVRENVYMKYVDLPEKEYHLYYNEFANPVLWLIQHYMADKLVSVPVEEDSLQMANLIFTPDVRSSYEDGYKRINIRFAKDIEKFVKDIPQARLMIQDYHYYLLPEYLREAGPELKMEHFIHIPWPKPEYVKNCIPAPILREILESMLANDVIGFQIARYKENFLNLVHDFLKADVDFENNLVRYQGRETLVQNYPISIDVDEIQSIAISEQGLSYTYKLAKKMEDTILIAGVERVDLSKGLIERLLAFELLLEEHPELVGKVKMSLMLVPSREEIEIYRNLRQDIKDLVLKINKKFSPEAEWDGIAETAQDYLDKDWPTVVLYADNKPYHEVLSALTVADIGVVNALADGMNLVAKETAFLNKPDVLRNLTEGIIKRFDDEDFMLEPAILVASRTMGAYPELRDGAIGVDPFSIEETADALYEAIKLSPKGRKVIPITDLEALDANKAAEMAEIIGRQVVENPLSVWIKSLLLDLDMVSQKGALDYISHFGIEAVRDVVGAGEDLEEVFGALKEINLTRKDKRGYLLRGNIEDWRDISEEERDKIEQVVAIIKDYPEIDLPADLGKLNFEQEIERKDIVRIEMGERAPPAKQITCAVAEHNSIYFFLNKEDFLDDEKYPALTLAILFTEKLIEVVAKQRVENEDLEWSKQLASEIHEFAIVRADILQALANNDLPINESTIEILAEHYSNMGAGFESPEMKREVLFEKMKAKLEPPVSKERWVTLSNGKKLVEKVERRAEHLEGKSILHINTTPQGGGVAELLKDLVPLFGVFGVDNNWLVPYISKIVGREELEKFFGTTKKFHNIFHGLKEDLTGEDFEIYESVSRKIGEQLEKFEYKLKKYDYIALHDPQTLGLLPYIKAIAPQAKIIWECHIPIELSTYEARELWKFFAEKGYFEQIGIIGLQTLDFAPTEMKERYGDKIRVMNPSINPIAPKNMPLSPDFIEAVLEKYEIDDSVPMITQVSRWDKLKGQDRTIDAYVKFFKDAREEGKEVIYQLLLIGGLIAGDDPEAFDVYEAIGNKIKLLEKEEPAIAESIKLITPTNVLTDKEREALNKMGIDTEKEQDWGAYEINAFQRIARVIMHLPLEEGYGLVVLEALNKGKTVISTYVGGIPLQIQHRENGFLVANKKAVYEAAKILYELMYFDPGELGEIGKRAEDFAQNNGTTLGNLKNWLEIMLDLEGLEIPADLEDLEELLGAMPDLEKTETGSEKFGMSLGIPVNLLDWEVSKKIINVVKGFLRKPEKERTPQSNRLINRLRGSPQNELLKIPSPVPVEIDLGDEAEQSASFSFNINYIKKVLETTPLKEIAPSAQFRVLTNEDLDFVIRIAKSEEETRDIFRSWGNFSELEKEDPERFDKWVKRVHRGKERGTQIFKERLQNSKAILATKELYDVNILEEDEDGKIHPQKIEKLLVQKKVDRTLEEALKYHYQKGEIDRIKEILKQIIKKTQEELWEYGVYDITFSFSLNWGVDYSENGVDVRLFDFYEITADRKEALQNLQKKIEQGFCSGFNWEIMNRTHPLSIISLTDEGIAEWFLDRIKKEFTLEKFEGHWGRKIERQENALREEVAKVKNLVALSPAIKQALSHLGDDLESWHRVFREEMRDIGSKRDLVDIIIWIEQGSGEIVSETISVPYSILNPGTEGYDKLKKYIALCVNIRGEFLGARQVGIEIKGKKAAKIDVGSFIEETEEYFRKKFFITVIDATMGKGMPKWREGKIEQGRIRVGQVHAGRYDVGTSIALLISGSDIKATAIEKGRRVYYEQIGMREGMNWKETLKKCITKAAKQVGIENPKEEIIYIAVPGPVDSWGNIVRIPPTKGLNQELLEKELRKDYPNIKFINDANAEAAFYRITWANVIGNEPTLVVVLRRGIGLALLKDGQLASWTGAPLETHFRTNLAEDAPLCNCGMQGCFELSDEQVVNRFLYLMKKKKLPDEFKQKMEATKAEDWGLLAKDIGEFLQDEGNEDAHKIARQVFKEYGKHLPILFKEIARMLDIDKIQVILCGGMVQDKEQRRAIIAGIADGMEGSGLTLRMLVKEEKGAGEEEGDAVDYDKIALEECGAMGAALSALQDKQMKMRIRPERAIDIDMDGQESVQKLAQEILEIFDLNVKFETPTVILNAGASGGGKTYFAESLKEILLEKRKGLKVVILGQDNYLLQKEYRRGEGLLEKYELARFWKDIKALKDGRAIYQPIFDQVSRVRYAKLGLIIDNFFAMFGYRLSEKQTKLFRRINRLTKWTGEAVAKVEADKDTIVVVDGILALNNEEINKISDYRIFINAPWKERLCAAVLRASDKGESRYGGISIAEVIEAFIFKRPEEEALINVSSYDANLLVSNNHYEKVIKESLNQILGEETYSRLNEDFYAQYFIIAAIMLDHSFNVKHIFEKKLGEINELMKGIKIKEMYEEGKGLQLEKDVCRLVEKKTTALQLILALLQVFLFPQRDSEAEKVVLLKKAELLDSSKEETHDKVLELISQNNNWLVYISMLNLLNTLGYDTQNVLCPLDAYFPNATAKIKKDLHNLIEKINSKYAGIIVKIGVQESSFVKGTMMFGSDIDGLTVYYKQGAAVEE
ncbi:MAG: HAD-IIB family hydrolase, partial [Candidatus Omnitrophica bacterium]|nr:HAD-IIB family hydrolase [Candidatus Omnitrophota bacterium]